MIARAIQIIMALLIVVSVASVGAQDAPHMALYIPRLGLYAPVGECPLMGDWHDTSQLGDGVCHLEGTATVAHDWARIVLAGHTPGGFELLRYVREGDQIVVWDAHAVEVYRVVLVTITTVDDTRWIMPTTNETLTLITCENDDRLIVHAEKEN